jgi:hypothetical protein
VSGSSVDEFDTRVERTVTVRSGPCSTIISPCAHAQTSRDGVGGVKIHTPRCKIRVERAHLLGIGVHQVARCSHRPAQWAAPCVREELVAREIATRRPRDSASSLLGSMLQEVQVALLVGSDGLCDQAHCVRPVSPSSRLLEGPLLQGGRVPGVESRRCPPGRSSLLPNNSSASTSERLG